MLKILTLCQPMNIIAQLQECNRTSKTSFRTHRTEFINTSKSLHGSGRPFNDSRRDRVANALRTTGRKTAKRLRECCSQELKHNCMSVEAALSFIGAMSKPRGHKAQQRFRHEDAEASRFTPGGIQLPQKYDTLGLAANHWASYQSRKRKRYTDTDRNGELGD